MKALYLDIGNSFLKMATRKESTWQILFEDRNGRLDELCSMIKSENKLKQVLISSVRRDLTNQVTRNLPEFNIREFRSSDIPSDMLDYKTPETLGLDRFLVCLGASMESKNRDVIVVDAGSACTVDLMTRDRVFCGGIIMPGLPIMKYAMESRLPELPRVADTIPDEWPGKSTTECIEWGLNGGFLFAVKGFLEKYRSSGNEPEVYITGGNAVQLMNWFEEDMSQVFHRKHLIWEGMEEFGKILKRSQLSTDDY